MTARQQHNARRSGHRKRRGYTLSELMLALSIFSFASVAMGSLMAAAYNTNREVKGMTDATSSTEITLRRMIEVSRSTSSLLFTNSASGLYLQTPSSGSIPSYIYIYYVSNNQLRERIELATTLALVQDTVMISNVTSFNVTWVNSGVYPKSYEFDLVVNSTPVPVTRSVIVTCRNLTS